VRARCLTAAETPRVIGAKTAQDFFSRRTADV
jgi:hypothetical protein